MLPQPRNTFSTTSSKSLIPHVLTKKPIPTAATVKKKPLPTPLKPKTDKPLVTNYSDESDNDDEVQNDFFSFNKKEEPIEEVQLDIDTPAHTIPEQKKPRDIQSYFKQDVVQDHVEVEPDYVESSSGMSTDQYSEAGSSFSSYEGQESSSSNAVLDEEAVSICIIIHLTL